MKDNRVVFDINKVQFARFFYRNQYGQTVDTLPPQETVRAMQFNPDDKCFMSDLTLIEYAEAAKLLDVWVPEVHLKITANCRLVFTGDKAKSIWKEWCRKQFNKHKQ